MQAAETAKRNEEKGNFDVKVSRVFQATPERLYKAILSPAFFEVVGVDGSCKADFKVGGRYHCDVESHKTPGTLGKMAGKFTELVPHKRIVFTWEYSCSGQLPDSSHVVLTLTPEGSGTRLDLVHHGLPSAESAADHNEGWTYLLGNFNAS